MSLHSLRRQWQEDNLWTSVFHIQGGTTESCIHTKIGASCSYTVFLVIQEDITCPQHYYRLVLPMDSFFHCTHMDTGSTKQMEGICRHQICSHSRRISSSEMETCGISVQTCWPHFKRNWVYDTVNIHTMVEWTTMTFTGTIQVAYNRVQHSYKQSWNQKCACCVCTNSRRRHTNIFQNEQSLQRYCIL
jgi:hypothetical protein